MNRRTTTKPDKGLLKLTPGVTVASQAFKSALTNQKLKWKRGANDSLAAGRCRDLARDMGKLVGNSTQKIKLPDGTTQTWPSNLAYAMWLAIPGTQWL